MKDLQAAYPWCPVYSLDDRNTNAPTDGSSRELLCNRPYVRLAGPQRD